MEPVHPKDGIKIYHIQFYKVCHSFPTMNRHDTILYTLLATTESPIGVETEKGSTITSG